MWISIDALSKRYGDFTALDRCSLSIERGEVFGLLGPNGAGKTTLLRLLMGFIRPTSGKATIGELHTYRDSVEVHRVATYLPGDVRLFRRMRAIEFLNFIHRLRSRGSAERGIAIANRMELDLTRRIGFMSTGMRQKLALAAVLASETQLIILDEPTSNLDPNVRTTVGHLVRELCDEGRTIIFSSHVMSEVEEICDRVAILRAGELVHTQAISELKRTHRIHARCDTDIPALPQEVAEQVELRRLPDGRVRLETSAELQPLLGWLATLELHELQIEPIGLRAVYDRFHSTETESPRPTVALRDMNQEGLAKS